MNQIATAFVIALLLGGCMSLSPPEWQAGLYVFLDSNTGATYQVALRCNLRTRCDAPLIAKATGAAGELAAASDEFRLQVDKRWQRVLTDAPVIASAPPLPYVAPQNHGLPPLRLKLDTEFASAKRTSYSG